MVQLTPEGKIVVYEKAVLAGSPSGPDTGSLVDLDKILSRNGELPAIYPVAVPATVIVGAMLIAFILYRWMRGKKR